MNGSAASPPNSSVNLMGISPDKTKEFQMELLMEKLRTKTSQYKTLADTSKAVRMTMLDKRWALDGMDRGILQKCLDSLQHRIKACTLQSLIERLECLSRQLGLKFMVAASGVELFISSDMFYLEILLESTGAVKDVKIHHEGKDEQQSCEELVSCISRGDFADFTAQLEGLTAMYQLNAEKKVKCKAFSALSALETDLGALAQLQACLKEPWAQVHKSPIGHVQKRRGGHAMRLTYFVSPYEVARCPSGALTAEALLAGAGLSAQVLLESAAAHKLQTAPLVTLPLRPQPNSGPMYAQLSVSNSATLPARFVLKLSQPMPVCGALLKMMTAAGEPEGGAPSPGAPTPPMTPLLALVAQNSTTTPINPHKGLFVTLPDQNQCYFLTETRGLDGCLVESVPFTHPRQVPALITRLRQQALFNVLIASCVRPNSKQDVESSVMVEVSALSWQHMSISLEQPGEGGMATLEIELPEGSAPRVSLHGGTGGGGAQDEKLARVLARTLSVPVTVRALLGRWERDARPGFRAGAGGPDPGGAPPSPRYPQHPQQQGNFLSEPQTALFGNQDVNLASIMGNNNGINMQQNTQQATIQNTAPPHQQAPAEERKVSKKRKHDTSEETWTITNPTKKVKPLVISDVLLPSSSSSSESDEDYDMGDQENAMHSNSSNDEEDETMASPTSQPISDLEFSALDPHEFIGGSSNDNRTSCSEISGDGDLNDLQDIDDVSCSANASSKSDSKKYKQKNRDQRSLSSGKLNTSLLLDLTESGLVPPAVSITPVSPASTGAPSSSPSFSSVLTSMCLDRRPGIEIIPISSSPQTSLPSSITITPITSSQAKSMDERHRSERKSSSTGKSRSSSSDRSKDKKKKKRREDSMGPPDKLPPKQDPLTKPVSVSIKPTDGSHSPLSIRSSSPNTLIRKFSSSPTHGRSVSITKTSSSGSPNSLKSMGKPSGSSSHHSSPRHSPVQCSPKHSLSGYSSPKNHGTSSPKHGSSSGSSGKPSMSTLKSAASGSPSGKSGSSGYELSKLSKVSSGKESSSGSSNSSSRDKDRKSSSGLSYSSSSGSSSPKMKSSSVKLKQLDLSATMTDVQSVSNLGDNLVSPSVDISKAAATSNQLRNRKGSLSAVIDKLKSAQHCGPETEISSKSSSSSSSSNKERTGTTSSKLTDSKTSSTSSSSKLSDSNKTQEYMVKPSSDGMKITINKTRVKDSNTSSSSSKSSSFSSSSGSGGSTSTTKQSSTTNVQSASGTGSPKTHTGLKPGVISGPASKKPQAMQSTKTGTTSSTNPSSTASGSPGLNSGKVSSGSTGVSSSSSKVTSTKSSSNSSQSGSIAPKSSKTSTGSPKMSSSATDLSKVSRDRDREREKSKIKSSSTSSSSSDKSIFSSSKSNERRSSPAPARDEIDGDRPFKMLSQHKDQQQTFHVEGLMKSLDTSKYQIPKLSARTASDDSSKAKNSPGNDKVQSSQTDMTNLNRNTITESSPKLIDYMNRPQDLATSKYSFQHLANPKLEPSQKSQPASTSSSMVTKPALNLSSTSPKLQSSPLPLLTSSKSIDSIDNLQPTNFSFSGLSKSQSDSSKDSKLETKSTDAVNRLNIGHQMHGASRDDAITVPKVDYPKPYPAISVCSAETINQSIAKQLEAHSNKGFTVPPIKTINEDASRKLMAMSSELGMKPPASLTKGQTCQEADVLLDFSSSSSKSGSDLKSKMPLAVDRSVVNMRRHTPPLTGLPTLPQAPSLSVHIVKSPAPSPLVIPSPHSNSPCITDDELMDEAVVGPGK